MAGELDKFKGKGGLPANPSAQPGAKLPSWADAKPGPTAADSALQNAAGRFSIALDATGSMGGLIDMAKRSIGEILKRVISGAGRPVEIMLVAYRDYDVPNAVVEVSKVTNDGNALIAWLSRVEAHGGGANDGEAIERALEVIMGKGPFDAIVIAGDEPANSAASVRKAKGKSGQTADEFARRFGQTQTPIHTFVIGDDERTIKSFKTIASLSGGKCGRLDGSAEMVDMAVMAMLSRLKGSDGVKAYMRDYRVSSRSAEFGNLLLEGPKK